jgi:hypothetical protein
MDLSPRVRYLLVTAAIVLASVIQLVRGYKPIIVIAGAVAFLLMGNLTVYLSGARQRAIRRQQKRDYYSS